jgi:enoyl-CoA hydratase
MVGYLELHRPEKANAYNEALLLEFACALNQIEGDNTVRSLVICGAGNRSFCAGADLEEMQVKGYSDALNLKSSKLFAAIASYPKVTVAAINGAAVAGGLELALACDIRISSKQARFFFPETKLGLIPAAGGTHRLSQVVGIGRAKELILGGQVWLAEDALRFGLVSEVVPPDALLACAQQWGERIGQRDPLALQLAKKAIDHRTSYNLESGVEAVAEALLYQVKFKKNNI